MSPRVVVVLSAALAPLLGQTSAPAPAAAPAAAPRLVVVCAVDQLARWVFAAAEPHFAADGGFRRLQARGVAFDECAFVHACTETGPGHATIGTGADARTHGIVKNEWFDAATRGKVYCVSEPGAAAVPEFPEGAGRGPLQLLVPTVGDLLREHSPASRVVAIAHKDRAAILMGGRRANAVVWFENSTGNFVTNAIWGAPEWLVALGKTRPADPWFGWNWERSAAAAAYADCVDDRKFEMVHASNGKRTLPVAIKGGRGDAPNAAFYLEAYLSPIANELVQTAALSALRGERLGQDDVPDLLCISYPASDTVGHYFGPDGIEARDTLLRFDGLLGRLLDGLDREVGAGRYAFVLTADHGVGLPPEEAKARSLGGGRALVHTRARAAAEQDLRAHFAATGGDPFVSYAGEYSLSLDRARIVAARPGVDAAVAFAEAGTVAAAAVAKVPGIARGYAVDEVLANGPGSADPLRAAFWHGLVAGRSGDVVFVVEPYWLEASVPASHGTPYAYDREVVLFAFGPGMAAGQHSMASVTPGLAAVLAAHWLGLDRPAAASDTVPDGVFVR